MIHRLQYLVPRATTGVVVALVVLAVGPLSDAVAADTNESESTVQVSAQLGTELDRVTRELVDPGDHFAADAGTIYCLTRVQGLEVPTTITHAWYHEGEAKARVTLKVGSSNWRTWSSKRILPAWTGAWEVKVLDASGKVLHTAAFVVE